MGRLHSTYGSMAALFFAQERREVGLTLEGGPRLDRRVWALRRLVRIPARMEHVEREEVKHHECDRD